MMYVLLGNLYLIVFYAFYRLFLSRETFFRWNRLYLLIGLLMAFILPLAAYPEWGIYAKEYQSYLFSIQAEELAIADNPASAGYSMADVLENMLRYVYIGGCVVTFLLFVVGLVRTVRMLRVDSVSGAYSFFGIVRVGSASDGYERISRHEQVHVQEWHSVDVMLMQLVKIFGWFNPVIYRYERAMRLQHEYIADERTALDDQIGYAELLVARAMGVERRVLVHTFSNKKLLKHRIAMLVRDKSPKRRLLKYTLLLPMVTMMAIFSIACNQDVSEPDVRSETTELREDVVFQSVEINPEPIGGMKAFFEYIGKNYDYPQAAIEAGVVGTIQVSFIVEKDGSLSDIRVVKDLGYGTGEAAVRVLQEGGEWSPAIQNGRKVRVAFTLPIRLNLQQ